MPRIEPLPEQEWGDELRPILEATPPGFDVRLGDNNIFPTLARHEQLFRAWLPFGGFLLGRGVLGARERELLILRTGFNCSSDYEWGQHVRIAESLGMGSEEIANVAAGPDAPGWSPTDATLLRAADELHEHSKIADDTWASLAETHDEQALLEIAILVGHYHMVAFALNSAGVQLDDGLTGLP
ncbi:MAG: carboxymuconolactone decarboxylase family protein [Solirubrobacteraceae bacterium]